MVTFFFLKVAFPEFLEDFFLFFVMAEVEQGNKTLTLAQEKEEQIDRGEIPVEASKDENPTNAAAEEIVTENSDVAPVAEKPDEIPITEKNDETPIAEENNETPVTEKTDEAPEAPEEEGSEEQEVVEQKPVIKIETAPADFRFPTTNQSRHCFTRYIEYHRCIAAKGEDAAECKKFAKYYRSLCPGEWIDRWNEQRENGTFPGPL
eukprot:TRINITY_DN5197_c0_g1_i2.p1 TRINITY_DN5197_c0_g1~~TRINITY_DN5197_c0_g1_i2.p1  ORF type:complete len:206 (-),score=50.40 TRINITY_DN5197_c0_g1_i2:270-887(-)